MTNKYLEKIAGWWQDQVDHTHAWRKEKSELPTSDHVAYMAQRAAIGGGLTGGGIYAGWKVGDKVGNAAAKAGNSAGKVALKSLGGYAAVAAPAAYLATKAVQHLDKKYTPKSYAKYVENKK